MMKIDFELDAEQEQDVLAVLANPGIIVRDMRELRSIMATEEQYPPLTINIYRDAAYDDDVDNYYVPLAALLERGLDDFEPETLIRFKAELLRLASRIDGWLANETAPASEGA
jgi:hypothetical protein